MTPSSLFAILLALLSACGGATPATGASDDTARPRDRLPRRASVAGYVAMLERPARAEWQRARELVESLAIPDASTIADVGCGSGYFLAHLSRAVGAEGRVVAEDIDAELVAHVRERVAREHLTNVEPRVGEPDDPGLERGRYDLVLMVDTYHHVVRPSAFLASVRGALRPGGRLVIVDFAPGVHVPDNVAHASHRVAPARVVADGRAAGLELAVERAWPPYQYVVELCAPPCP